MYSPLAVLSVRGAKCLSHEKVMTSCGDMLIFFGKMLTFLGSFGVKVFGSLL